ncbi:MAG: hypothetical protein IKG85_07215 [Clostridia bacterium]|nr:hypothetical protein [Clostridia bacterium]
MENKINYRNSGSLLEIVEKAFNSAHADLTEKGMDNKNAVSTLVSKIDPAMNGLYAMASDGMFDYLREHMYEAYCHANGEDAEFLFHHDTVWGDCFVASRLLYEITVEATNLHSEYISASISKKEFLPLQYTFQVMQHLQGRACQIYLEILELVKGGFADGAMARWRSLYELCCIGQFIIDNGEAIAKEYFEQAETDDQRYRWANSIIDKNNNKVTTFKQIQELCSIEPVWIQEYKLGCFVTHASAQGTFKRLGNFKALNMIPTGRSDYGIDIPAGHSALSLSWISNLLLSIFPNVDSLTHGNVISKWSNYTERLYYDKKIEVFGEKDELVSNHE